MPLDSTPRMLADPVSGFFAGFTSFFARILIGGAAIFAGYLVCGFSTMGWDSTIIAGWPLLSIGMIFWWGTYGGWFVLGLFSLITIFAGLWAFVNGSDGKISFFVIFTASAVYFAPVIFPTGMKPGAGFYALWAAGIYAAIAVCYWVLPAVIAGITNRNEGESIPEEDEAHAATDAAENSDNSQPPETSADSNETDA